MQEIFLTSLTIDLFDFKDRLGKFDLQISWVPGFIRVFWLATSMSFFWGCTSRSLISSGDARQTTFSDEQRRSLAVQNLKTAFSATQTLTFISAKGKKTLTGFFYVAPGVGYRMRLFGPTQITVFDLLVVCDHYVADSANHHHEMGKVGEDDQRFSMTALSAMFDLPQTGHWQGDHFASSSKDTIAVLDPHEPAFSHFEIKNNTEQHMTIDVLAFSHSTERLVLPARLQIILADGSRVEITNNNIITNVVPAEKALGRTSCQKEVMAK